MIVQDRSCVCNNMSQHLAHIQDPVNRWLHTYYICYLLELSISCNILSRHLAQPQNTVNKWLHTYYVCYLLELSISCNNLSRHLAHTQDPVNRWLQTVHVCYLTRLKFKLNAQWRIHCQPVLPRKTVVTNQYWRVQPGANVVKRGNTMARVSIKTNYAE
jgi:hypothetical protein